MDKERTKARSPVEQLEAGQAFFSALGLEVAHFGPLWHILKVAQLLETELNRIAGGHGLSIADFHLLGALMMDAEQPMRPTDIARALNVSNAVLTLRLRKLAAEGLVARGTDPADRRAVILHLTPLGSAKVRAIGLSIEREARFLSWFRQLPPADLQWLGCLVGNLHAFLDRDFLPAPRPEPLAP